MGSHTGAGQRGSASVEHAALVLLIALVACAVAAVVSLDGPDQHNSLASAIAQKQRCAVRFPDPCWQDPLTAAYGRGLDGVVRALAPAPSTMLGPAGLGLVGVDYRRCRQAHCATPLPGPAGLHLTIANRRTTAFTSVREGRSPGAGVEIDYWIYRPTIGWELIRRLVDRSELASYAGTPLLDSADPVLVPLETLLGRDDAKFPPGEIPPWQGRIESQWAR
ncbi:MAG: hypothetical protein H0V25_09000 [Solirubrobacterales bacterium]|nr:hypothetical protein [Solirubrobacterales bacterium]